LKVKSRRPRGRQIFCPRSRLAKEFPSGFLICVPDQAKGFRQVLGRLTGPLLLRCGTAAFSLARPAPARSHIPVDPYPGVDESFARLHASGWSAGDVRLPTPAGLLWLVTATNGENRIDARPHLGRCVAAGCRAGAGAGHAGNHARPNASTRETR